MQNGGNPFHASSSEICFTLSIDHRHINRSQTFRDRILNRFEHIFSYLIICQHKQQQQQQQHIPNSLAGRKELFRKESKM